MKQIKNIRLISEYDPEYMNYRHSFKTSTKQHATQEKSTSEMVAYVLELATREWLKELGQNLEDRIIAYDIFNRRTKKWVTQYSEVDYILKKDGALILGEVKASFDRSNVLSKAVTQLTRKKELLHSIGHQHVKLQIVFFDFACKYSSERIHSFDRHFNQMKFSIFTRNNQDFEFLHLNPKEIYDWGVQQGVIRTPELVDIAVKKGEIKAESRNLKRMEYNAIINKSRPVLVVSIPQMISCSTQGLCERSRFLPTNAEISRVLCNVKEDFLENNTIIIARHKWLKAQSLIIPESNKLLNMCIEIKNRIVIRAFYSETMERILKKLNYHVHILN